jgi:hypothetical protein
VDQQKFDDWALQYATSIGSAANGKVNAGMLKAFLMNVDPGDGTAEAYLVIAKIAPKSGGADITVEAVNGKGAQVALPKKSGSVDIYGAIEIWGTSALEDPFVVDGYVYPVTSAINPVSGDMDKYFYKAYIVDPSKVK